MCLKGGRLSILGLLISLMPCGTICAQNANAGFLGELYNTLSQNALLDRSYQIPTEKAFRDLLETAGIPQPLNLNGPYAAGSLNVYIVKLTATDVDHISVRDERHRQILRYLRNNVLALPPNAIAIDGQFLADLALNAWNENISLQQGMKEERILRALGEPAEKAADRIVVLSVIGEVYRFGNIRNSRNRQSADVASGLGPALSFLDEPRALAFSVAPVFYHELGHLHDNSFGSMFDFIDDIAKYFASYRVRRQEDAADAYAITQLKHVFSEKMRQNGNQEPPLLAYQSVAATIKLLRDKALIDMFSGLRGLESEDHFVTFTHKDCQKHPETADMNFYDPRKIDSALFQFVPLVTKDEFNQLRSKVESSVHSATHAHNFIRGDHMLAAVDDVVDPNHPKTNTTFMQSYTLLLDSLINNNPTRLYDYFKSAAMRSSGIGFDRLRQGLDMDFQPAVSCPPDMCMIGFFKDGQPGFVELVGPLTNLRSIRLAFPLFGAKPRDVLLGKSADEYKKRLSFLETFMLNALNLPKGSAPEQRLQLRLRNLLPMAKKCGVVPFVAADENNILFMTTLNPDFWVNVEVLAKGDLDSRTQ